MSKIISIEVSDEQWTALEQFCQSEQTWKYDPRLFCQVPELRFPGGPQEFVENLVAGGIDAAMRRHPPEWLAQKIAQATALHAEIALAGQPVKK